MRFARCLLLLAVTCIVRAFVKILISKDEWLAQVASALAGRSLLDGSNPTVRAVASETYDSVLESAPLNADKVLWDALDVSRPDTFRAVWTHGTMSYIARHGCTRDSSELAFILRAIATKEALTSGLALDATPPALLIAQNPASFAADVVAVVADALATDDASRTDAWPSAPVVTRALAVHALQSDTADSLDALKAWCKAQNSVPAALLDAFLSQVFATQTYEEVGAFLESPANADRRRRVKSIFEVFWFKLDMQVCAVAPLSIQTHVVSDHFLKSLSSITVEHERNSPAQLLYESVLFIAWNAEEQLSSVQQFLILIARYPEKLRQYYAGLLSVGHDGRMPALGHVLRCALHRDDESFVAVLELAVAHRTDVFMAHDTIFLVREVLSYERVLAHLDSAEYGGRLRDVVERLPGALGRVLRAIAQHGALLRMNAGVWPRARAECSVASWALDESLRGAVPDWCLGASAEGGHSVAQMIHEYSARR